MRAARYFERRLLHSTLLLVAVSSVAFALSQFAPGSFLDELKLNPQISPQTIDALRMQYGIGQPLSVRYFRWLRSVAAGDFGYSLAYNAPVSRLLGERLRHTLLLGCVATTLSWIVALGMGLWSAYKPRSWMDRGFSGVAALLLGTPELVLALVAMLAISHFGTEPESAFSSAAGSDLTGAILGRMPRLFLPSAVLALAGLPVLFRHIRAALLEALSAPYLLAARGHGIGELRLLLRHALPTAANPLISLFGLSLAGLVSGSFLVEVITGWPGIGPLFLDSIYARDFHVVVAVVMLFSTFLVLANLAADLLLYSADPRVRAA